MVEASVTDQDISIPPALVEALGAAHQVTVLTGAGVSAESGVPTFRDAQEGLWARYEPQQLATPEAFEADPKLVWQWYRWRRELIDRVAPNAGHYALAELEVLCPSFTLVTQNVDGLHRVAGSANLVEFHGNIHRDRCFLEGVVVEPVPDDDREPPGCPRCDGPVRPDVVWFGEAIPADALHTALEATDRTDVFVAVGTSATVHPAAGLIDRALDAGAVVAEINPEASAVGSRVHHALAAGAGGALAALVHALRQAGE